MCTVSQLFRNITSLDIAYEERVAAASSENWGEEKDNENNVYDLKPVQPTPVRTAVRKQAYQTKIFSLCLKFSFSFRFWL